jgi:hypothetical protein
MRTLAFILLLAASPAFAGSGPTLNGVWEGSYSCKAGSAGGKDSFKVTATLFISQGSITEPLTASISATTFSGAAIPSTADSSSGAGALIACGTTAAAGALLNWIETFYYQVDEGGGGTLKTSGAFLDGVLVGTCKGTWKRVSNEPVKAGGCAP